MNRILFSGKISCENVRQILKWSSIKSNTDIICVAKMIYNHEEFWAVYGVNTDETKNIKALKSIIPDLDNNHICKTYKKNSHMEASYYHYTAVGDSYKWTIIPYSGYQSVIKKKIGIDENYRLFSCCERKLLSRLDDNNDSFKMYVAFPPCYMCEHAFMYLVDYGNTDFEVHYVDTPSNLETECENHLKDLKLI